MNNLDPQEFADELMLMAENDGDSYRKGRSAEMAIRKSFADFQRRRRQEERDEFNAIVGTLVASLAERWKED